MAHDKIHLKVSIKLAGNETIDEEAEEEKALSLPEFKARIERKHHIPPGNASLYVNGSEFPQIPVPLGTILKDGDVVTLTADTAHSAAADGYNKAVKALSIGGAVAFGVVSLAGGGSKYQEHVNDGSFVRGGAFAENLLAREALGGPASRKEKIGVVEAESVADEDTNRSVIDGNKDGPKEDAPRLFPGPRRRRRHSAITDRSSSKHDHFRHHVAFDNIKLPRGDTTRQVTRSLTLNVRHKEHRVSERSRTFMVGLSSHSQSDFALQWLLHELVEDDDEVVCVSVLEKDGFHWQGADYKREAENILHGIVEKAHASYAISIVLEYAIGNLLDTFQQLVQTYKPILLVIGTSGRSLSGIRHRDSFSKYCLKYMPIPVVIFRSLEQRARKRQRRAKDWSRQTYRGMLKATGGIHEADSDITDTYQIALKILPDEELYNGSVRRRRGLRETGSRPSTRSTTAISFDDSPLATRYMSRSSPHSSENEEENVGEEEEDEYDGFEVMSGATILDQQRKLGLHDQARASEAALLPAVLAMDDEDGDESQRLEDLMKSSGAATVLYNTKLLDEELANESQHETSQNLGSDPGATLEKIPPLKLLLPVPVIYTKGYPYCLSAVLELFFPVPVIFRREPPVLPGKARVRWTCTCGEELYDDFREVIPGALVRLQERLLYQAQTKSPAQVSSTAAQMAHSLREHLNAVGLFFGQIADQMRALGRQPNKLPLHNEESGQAAQTQQPPAPSSPVDPPPILLLCIGMGVNGTWLRQELLKNVHDDATFFKFLRSQSSKHRGRLSWLSLRGVSRISLTRFRVDANHFAEVHHHDIKCINKCVCLPPLEKLQAKEYLCNPAPEQELDHDPPIATNTLTHYFRQPHCLNTLQTSVFNQVPKRARGVLSVGPDESQLGWGIYIADGWHWRLIYFVIVVPVLLGGFIFGIAWSVTKGDIQSAFAIAASWMALAPVLLGYIAIRDMN